MIPHYDVAVVGMGIVGLAHALAAARAGLKGVVIDREPAARGASIRNFGFVTVSGQARGEMWGLARRTRDVWASTSKYNHLVWLRSRRRPASPWIRQG